MFLVVISKINVPRALALVPSWTGPLFSFAFSLGPLNKCFMSFGLGA